MDRTLLILGASGRLGRLLRRVWTAAPPPGLRCVWQVRGTAGPGEIGWDPLGAAAVTSALDRADAVLCLLGVTAGPPRDLARNTPLALAALAAATALGARRCLIASTAAVYGPAEGAAEDAPLAPASAYGRAKAAMESAVMAQAAPGTAVLRIGNVAGADALLGAVGLGRMTLDRFADGGGPVRSYIGPQSLAATLAALAVAADLPTVLNVAAPRPVTMAALLEAAALSWGWRPAPPGAVQRATLDTARLQALVPLPVASATPTEMVRQWRAWGNWP
jgi:nucleoside-diphosphate-sugar epimerase